jgi:hypothetical protein
MALYRVIYCSEACGLEKQDVESILEASNRNNAASVISGMLLFNSGYFLQLLEGSRANVSDTFLRIARDKRHKNVELILGNTVSKRIFHEWNMNYVSITGDVGQTLRKHHISDAFNPYTLSQKAAKQLCHEISEISTKDN